MNKDIFKELSSLELDEDKVIVWIDPLDGTKDFVNGKKTSSLLNFKVGLMELPH